MYLASPDWFKDKFGFQRILHGGSGDPMAQIQLQVPAPFNFANPDDWSRWKKRFQQYRCASGLDKEEPARQISTLLYCLGEEAGAVLDSTNATEDEIKVYDTVIGKFDSYFKVRKNVIYERARFNRRSQLQGESAEQYIMKLYRLAETCEYRNFMEEMIRDRLVVGIADNALSGRLQLDPDLTQRKLFDKVKLFGSSKETSKREQTKLKLMRQDSQDGREAGQEMTKARGNMTAEAKTTGIMAEEEGGHANDVGMINTP